MASGEDRAGGDGEGVMGGGGSRGLEGCCLVIDSLQTFVAAAAASSDPV
jgi:hypothetical protein